MYEIWPLNHLVQSDPKWAIERTIQGTDTPETVQLSFEKVVIY